MSAAIANDYDVEIDRYVRMNFENFTDLIDAVGGISINVERAVEDYAYPTADGGTIALRFDPGWQHMDGERALQYARTRHGDDDYRRADRQQQVMTALSLKLLNPLNWPAVANTLSRSVDTDLTLWDMAKLAPTVVLNAGQFERRVIGREDLSATSGGLTIPNYEALAPWIRERFD